MIDGEGRLVGMGGGPIGVRKNMLLMQQIVFVQHELRAMIMCYAAIPASSKMY